MRVRGLPGLADAEVIDRQVLAEIELYAELVIAATASAGPLPPARVDQLLGVGGRTVDLTAARPSYIDLRERPASRRTTSVAEEPVGA